MRTLIPLYAHPRKAPGMWSEVALRGSHMIAVVPVPGSADDGPDLAMAITLLAEAGVQLLGRIDLGYAVRPIRELCDDIARCAAYPVHGVFLDHAPTTPFSLGPVALAVRTAMRAGYRDVILNPGTAPDPIYRQLGARICVFDGSWSSYLAWSGHGAKAGDGHLVHSVPPDTVPYAQRLVECRGAGFGLVTDHTPPEPYAALPTWWCDAVTDLTPSGAVTAR